MFILGFPFVLEKDKPLIHFQNVLRGISRASFTPFFPLPLHSSVRMCQGGGTPEPSSGTPVRASELLVAAHGPQPYLRMTQRLSVMALQSPKARVWHDSPSPPSPTRQCHSGCGSCSLCHTGGLKDPGPITCALCPQAGSLPPAVGDAKHQ